jgi:hypothetical protein
MKRGVFVFVLTLGVVASLGGRALAAVQITRNFTMPVQLKLQATATNCTNTGSEIEISGTLALGSVGVKMRLQNNTKGTHTSGPYSDEGTLTLTPSAPINIPKQPVKGGVGGNPKIWFQATDPQGNALTPVVYLGRCVQGAKLNNLSAALSVPGFAQALFSALECSNKKTDIKIDGSSESGGIGGKLMFTNNDKGTHENGPYDGVVGFNLSNGIRAPKQGNLGGAGGNPLVYGNFVLNGNDLTSPILLGRCNKL